MKKTESQYVELPEEYTRRKLNALYREIPLNDKTSRLLRKYFNAMANLYGCIPLHKAREIISTLSPGLVTSDEFLAFAEIARHECEGYYILGEDELYTDVRHTEPLNREIIEPGLFYAPDDGLGDTRDSQMNMPYYVPDKKSFLNYYDPDYSEDTPEKLNLCAFLSEYLNPEEQSEEIILGELANFARASDACMEEIFECMEFYGVRLKSHREVSRFTELYRAFFNSTRMPRYRGHTPEEAKRLMLPDAMWESLYSDPHIQQLLQTGNMDDDELCKAILAANMPSESMARDLHKRFDEIKAPVAQPVKVEKIGRNDPCPCGSGKKYKKCCGRRQ